EARVPRRRAAGAEGMDPPPEPRPAANPGGPGATCPPWDLVVRAARSLRPFDVRAHEAARNAVIIEGQDLRVLFRLPAPHAGETRVDEGLPERLLREADLVGRVLDVVSRPRLAVERRVPGRSFGRS